MDVIKVAIIDQTGFYIDAVLNVLEQQPDIHVTDTQTIFEDTFRDLAAAEIIILQQETYRLTRRLIQQITTALPEAKLIVLGAPDDERTLVDYIESGAIGYVRDTESFDQLLQVVRVVHNGGTVVHPELIAPLCERLAGLGRSIRELYPDGAEAIDLTARQEEVMDLLVKGHSNQEIADELSISIGTVKNHIHKIFARLGVSSRDQAAVVYSKLKNETDSSAE